MENMEKKNLKRKVHVSLVLSDGNIYGLWINEGENMKEKIINFKTNAEKAILKRKEKEQQK